MNRLPEFLVIGAQKAGTSWLHRHLRDHPNIFMPEQKDQGHFCWCEGPRAETLEQYQKAFEDCSSNQVAGEATAAYFWTGSGSEWDVKPEGYCEDLPKRVRDTLGGETRLILSLRDPVERAVSAYIHHLALGDIDPRTSLLDAGSFVGLIDIGFYTSHLQNWLRCFPLRQFLVLDFEQDITKQPEDTIRRAFAFLGVDPDWPPSEPERVVFEGRERIWLDGEVWVPLDQYPEAPADHRRSVDGQAYCLRVDRATVDGLRELYAQDQQMLCEVLV